MAVPLCCCCTACCTEIPLRCRTSSQHSTPAHLVCLFFFTVPLASEVVLYGGRAGASGPRPSGVLVNPYNSCSSVVMSKSILTTRPVSAYVFFYTGCCRALPDRVSGWVISTGPREWMDEVGVVHRLWVGIMQTPLAYLPPSYHYSSNNALKHTQHAEPFNV